MYKIEFDVQDRTSMYEIELRCTRWNFDILYEVEFDVRYQNSMYEIETILH